MNEELKQKITEMEQSIAAMQLDLAASKKKLSLIPHFSDAITDIVVTGMGYSRLGNRVVLSGEEAEQASAQGYIYLQDTVDELIGSKTAIKFPTPTPITDEFVYSESSGSVTIATSNPVLMIASVRIYQTNSYSSVGYLDSELTIEGTSPQADISVGTTRMTSDNRYSLSTASVSNLTIFSIVDGSQYLTNPLKLYIRRFGVYNMTARIDVARFGLIELIT